MLNTRRFRQHRMLSRLSTSIESRFKFAFSRWDDLQSHKSESEHLSHIKTALWAHQHRQIGLRCTTNHIRHEAFVTGRIEDGKMFLISLKVSSTNFNCFAFVSLCELHTRMKKSLHFHLTYRKAFLHPLITHLLDLYLKPTISTSSHAISHELLSHISRVYVYRPFRWAT